MRLSNGSTQLPFLIYMVVKEVTVSKDPNDRHVISRSQSMQRIDIQPWHIVSFLLDLKLNAEVDIIFCPKSINISIQMFLKLLSIFSGFSLRKASNPF